MYRYKRKLYPGFFGKSIDSHPSRQYNSRLLPGLGDFCPRQSNILNLRLGRSERNSGFDRLFFAVLFARQDDAANKVTTGRAIEVAGR